MDILPPQPLEGLVLFGRAGGCFFFSPFSLFFGCSVDGVPCRTWLKVLGLFFGRSLRRIRAHAHHLTPTPDRPATTPFPQHLQHRNRTRPCFLGDPRTLSSRPKHCARFSVLPCPTVPAFPSLSNDKAAQSSWCRPAAPVRAPVFSHLTTNVSPKDQGPRGRSPHCLTPWAGPFHSSKVVGWV